MKDELTEVRVIVELPYDPGRQCSLVKYGGKKPDLGQYDNWAEAQARAVKVADQSGLDSVRIEFTGEGGRSVSFDSTLRYFASGDPKPLAVHPLVEIEKYFNSRGYETQCIGTGMYAVEKPDAVGGIRRKRGYFDVEQLLSLVGMDSDDLDAALNESWREHMKRSKYTAYSLTPTIRGGNSMAKKNEEKAEKPTAKGTGGKDVELSPKQVETLEAIRKGEKSGKPLGSGESRLDDATSIAAMKLAAAGVVHRTKVGVRWHYFATQGAAKKAEEVAVKEAAKAKKPAASKQAAKKGASPAAAGKKKTGPLKKPSEK